MSQGRIIIVSGPSGVGKGTILRTVMQQHESLHYSVSATSRPMRPEDREGVSYYFVSRERFEEMIAAGELLEHACYAGNYYGTPLRPVEEALARGESVVLEIDVQGCLQAMEQDSEVTGIFVSPPSRENLEKRLRARGTESEESLNIRLHNAAREVEQAYRYDYIVVHQDWDEVPDALDRAIEQVYAIIEAARAKTKHNMRFLNALSASLKAGK